MPDPSSSSSSSSAAPRHRAPRGEIRADNLRAIELADSCARSAAEPEYQPGVTARAWTPANQTALTAAVTRATGLVRDIKAARAGKKSRTREEEAARAELLAALDPILAGAKRTFAEGAGERDLFGVGSDPSSATTARLYRLALDSFRNLSPGTGGTPAAYTLRGVLPAEITRLGDLGQAYKDANFAQGDAGLGAAELLDTLTAYLDATLNPLRRELQFAAEQAWPARDPANRSKRLAFGLPPTRPMTE
ncbi:MAG: hypothetical protein ABI318_09590 [Chthoniobacteraceae bacterium]